jgi:hypothetical protein
VGSIKLINKEGRELKNYFGMCCVVFLIVFPQIFFYYLGKEEGEY